MAHLLVDSRLVEPPTPGAYIALSAPLHAGGYLHLFLYGLVVSAVFNYLGTQSYRTDNLYLKSTLWTVFALESLNVVLNLQQVGRLATTQRATIGDFLGSRVADAILPLTTGLSALLVQLYLGRRASGLFTTQRIKKIFMVCIGALIVASFVGSCLTSAAGIVYAQQSRIILGRASFNQYLAVWLWLSVATDITITVTLFFVFRAKIAGFNSSTDDLLRDLMQLAVKTGLYTSTLAAVGAIVATIFPALEALETSNIPTALWVSLSSLYALSLVANLSHRESLRRPQVPVGPNVSLAHSGPSKEVDPGVIELGEHHFDGRAGRGRSRCPRCELTTGVIGDFDERTTA